MVKKLHSFRCEDEVWAAITAHADSAGISANQIMERIVARVLGTPMADDDFNVISTPIADLEARVRALEKAIAKGDSKSIATSKPAKAKAISKPIAVVDSDGWLTTGDAHALMQARHGYKAALTTFRRHLRSAQKSKNIPESLRTGGVVELDFEGREIANPKSNAVKWIKVGD